MGSRRVPDPQFSTAPAETTGTFGAQKRRVPDQPGGASFVPADLPPATGFKRVVSKVVSPVKAALNVPFQAGQRTAQEIDKLQAALMNDPVNTLSGLLSSLQVPGLMGKLGEKEIKYRADDPEFQVGQSVGRFGGKEAISQLLFHKVPVGRIAKPLQRPAKVLAGELPFAPELIAEGKPEQAAMAFLLNLVGEHVAGRTVSPKNLAKKTIAPLTAPEDVAGVKLQPSAAPPKTFREKLPIRGTTLVESDRHMLSLPYKKGETPFSDFVRVQKALEGNPGGPSALDVASRRGTAAQKLLAKKRQQLGSKKGAIIKGSENVPIDSMSARLKFYNDVAERVGGVFDADGNLVSAPGRELIIGPEQRALLEDIHRVINVDEITVRRADDIKRKINSLIDEKKAQTIQPKFSQSEGITRNLRKHIDDELVKVVGPKFRKINQQFGDIAEMEDWVRRRSGEVVDPATGQTRMGAGLMKSALQSNADRGTKAMFERIKKATGIDLFKEAKLAEIAMRLSGDPRSRSMLADLGVMAAAVTTGRPQAAAGRVPGLAQSLKRDPLQEAVEFYIKQHGGKIPTRAIKKAVKKTAEQTQREALERRLGTLGGL